ncbi:MAG: hypothetical protein AAGL49_03070, partial [Pseudomonadota bacterium]
VSAPVLAADLDVLHLESLHGLHARLHDDPLGGDERVWLTYLQKWDCSSDTTADDCSRKNGTPVEYVVREANVDPASIGVTAPDQPKGEAGWAVRFACSKIGDIKCLSTPRIGDFGGYKSCEERGCGPVEQEVEAAALALARTRAAQGRMTIECPGEEACARVAANFRAFVDLAAGRTHIAAVEDVEELVGRVDRAARGAVFAKQPAEGAIAVVIARTVGFADEAAFVGEVVRLDADGRLHIEQGVCKDEAAAGCAEAEDREQRIHHVELAGLNPSHIYVHDFTSKTIGGRRTEYDGYAVYLNCRADRQDCVQNEGISTSGFDVFIPCPDDKACKQVFADISGLASFAGTPGFADWLAVRSIAAETPTPISNKRQVDEALKRIEAGFDDRRFEMTYAEETYLYTQETASITEDGWLIIGGTYCVKGEECPEEETRTHELEIDLASLPETTFEFGELKIDGGPYLALFCPDETYCLGEVQDGFMVFDSTAARVACGEYGGCEAMRRDLLGLAAYAADAWPDGGGKRPPAAENDPPTQELEPETGPRTDPSPEKIAAADPDLPRKVRRHAEDLSEISNGVRLRLAAAEGRSVRVLKGAGVFMGVDGKLIVRRRACLALLASDLPQENECRLETLFQDYNVEIGLAQLDRGSIDVREGAQNVGERGMWVAADCKGGVACARLVMPERPNHLILQTRTLMNSFVETETSPKIRIPCGDGRACDDAAKALKALVKDAARRAPKTPKKRGGDLVGVWEFDTPWQSGWITEYRADGTFTFTNANSKTDGTYTAKNGQWTQSSPSFNFNDTGTYRFLDEETLELTGKYGVSVWKRRD